MVIIDYSILFYPITLGGRRGTTDEFATIPFHLDLFSAALVELAKSIPVHSLILSSHLFFCLPLFLFPFTVPCRIVFAKPEDLETWPNHLSFRFLTRVRSSSYSPMAAWIFLRTSSLVTWSLYEMFNSLRQHLISQACVLFSNSAVKVHDSQAYINMEMTRERISFTFDPRDMLLSLQMGFSFVRAAVACAILERTSGLEPSSETTAPRYLKLVTVPSFCPFTFISLWMTLALFVISLVFSGLISICPRLFVCKLFRFRVTPHTVYVPLSWNLVYIKAMRWFNTYYLKVMVQRFLVELQPFN